MKRILGYLLFIALCAQAPTSYGLWGPTTSNDKWGNCYNEAYKRKYPNHGAVGDPIYLWGNSVNVRSEIMECKNEFKQWIRDEGQKTDTNRMYSKILLCYINTGDRDYCTFNKSYIL